jgi:hypothetical protein
MAVLFSFLVNIAFHRAVHERLYSLCIIYIDMGKTNILYSKA